MLGVMSRWEPDARGRLERAALDLFAQHGYDQTTVEQIAAVAGVTKRTFFRHFADKREVLFGGSGRFLEMFVDSLADATHVATPFQLLSAILKGVGVSLGADRELMRRRQAVILDSVELQERELVKMAAVTNALAAALRDRGTAEMTARVTAEVTAALFRAAFEDWLATDQGELSDSVHDALDTVRNFAEASDA